MSDEQDEVPGKPGGRGGNKLLPIILVLNTALMGGVLFFSMKKPAAPSAAAHGAEKGEKGEGGEGEEKGEGEHESGDKKDKHGAASADHPGPILKLENFVIQLKTVDADRYVRLAFDLELGNDADQTVVNGRLSAIRDLVIGYFADRTLDELRGSEAMENTKATLIKRIDEIVPGHRIRKLYITDFIIQ